MPSIAIPPYGIKCEEVSCAAVLDVESHSVLGRRRTTSHEKAGGEEDE
jgi:hypothetical protein